MTKPAQGSAARAVYRDHDADALLTTDDGTNVTTYTWDDAGNNTLVEASAGVTTMTWSDESRMLTIQVPGGSVVTNTYDSSGLRRKREEGAATVDYIWDDQRLLLEADGSDVTQALYTSGLGQFGPTVAQRRSDATSHYHPDHLGSIWALTDSDETTSDTCLYDAWGNVQTSSGSTTNPLRYVGALGYYGEADVGLFYVRARWLRPRSGSWLSVDRVRGQRRYTYVAARVLRFSDANGLQTSSLDDVPGLGDPFRPFKTPFDYTLPGRPDEPIPGGPVPDDDQLPGHRSPWDLPDKLPGPLDGYKPREGGPSPRDPLMPDLTPPDLQDPQQERLDRIHELIGVLYDLTIDLYRGGLTGPQDQQLLNELLAMIVALEALKRYLEELQKPPINYV